MKKKLIVLVLMTTMVFSLAACGNKEESNTAAASTEAAASSEDGTQPIIVMDDTEESDTTESVNEASTEDASVAERSTEDAESDTEAGEENAAGTIKEYEWASIKYTDDGMIIMPNGNLTDDTVIYNGKTFGEYVDYVNSEVLETNRTINKEFLRALLAINIVDSQFITDFDQLDTTMMFCSTIANDFYNTNVEVHYAEIKALSPGTQMLSLHSEDKPDIWYVDLQNKKFYFNQGNTEYTSSMFQDKTLTIWDVVIHEFFGVEY